MSNVTAQPVNTNTNMGNNQNNQNDTLITKEGLEKLKTELDYLTNTRRKEVAQRIKEAISYGDLSENSEYEDSKNEQAFVEGRIMELTKMIKSAKIIKDKIKKTATVQIGSTVIIKNLTEKSKDDEGSYTIVGSTEADPLNAKISNESPIGSAILGHAEGEKISVHVPAGVFQYEIIKII